MASDNLIHSVFLWKILEMSFTVVNQQGKEWTFVGSSYLSGVLLMLFFILISFAFPRQYSRALPGGESPPEYHSQTHCIERCGRNQKVHWQLGPRKTHKAIQWNFHWDSQKCLYPLPNYLHFDTLPFKMLPPNENFFKKIETQIVSSFWLL